MARTGTTSCEVCCPLSGLWLRIRVVVARRGLWLEEYRPGGYAMVARHRPLVCGNLPCSEHQSSVAKEYHQHRYRMDQILGAVKFRRVVTVICEEACDGRNSADLGASAFISSGRRIPLSGSLRTSRISSTPDSKNRLHLIAALVWVADDRHFVNHFVGDETRRPFPVS